MDDPEHLGPNETHAINSADGFERRLAEVGTASLADGGAEVVDGISMLGTAGRIAGRAATAWVPHGDNLALQAAVASAVAGEVVVCAVAPPEASAGAVALVGDVLATAAVTAGVVGIVVDGHVRDVAAMAMLPLVVAGQGISPRGPAKHGGGGVGVPVAISGVTIEPGDWIAIDDDGVAVLPAGSAIAILDAAEAKAAREPAILREIVSGRSTLEVLCLDSDEYSRTRRRFPGWVG